MPTFTSNYGLSKPLVNNATDQDIWGNELNGNADELDSLLSTAINFTVSPETTSFSIVAPTTESANTGDSHKLFLCDATSGVLTGTLPTASSAGNGFTVGFKKTDSAAHAVTAACSGGDLIDGDSTYSISTQYGWVVLVSDGVSKWSIVSNAINLNGAVITLGNGSTAPDQSASDSSTKVANTETVHAIVAAATTGSLTSNGYRINPDGYIEQWGTVAVNGTGTVTVNLPHAFANAPFLGTATATVIGSALGFAANVVSASTTQIVLYSNNSGSYSIGWTIDGH